MMRLLFAGMGLVLALATPAAADCAGDIDIVQQAFNAAADLDEEEKAVINDALSDAKANTANEQDCQDALADAREILNIE